MLTIANHFSRERAFWNQENNISEKRIDFFWVPRWLSHPTSAQVMISHEFEVLFGLCADSSEPGACFGFCVSLSLCPSPAQTLSVCLSQQINKHLQGWKKDSLFCGLHRPNFWFFFLFKNFLQRSLDSSLWTRPAKRISGCPGFKCPGLRKFICLWAQCLTSLSVWGLFRETEAIGCVCVCVCVCVSSYMCACTCAHMFQRQSAGRILSCLELILSLLW